MSFHYGFRSFMAAAMLAVLASCGAGDGAGGLSASSSAPVFGSSVGILPALPAPSRIQPATTSAPPVDDYRAEGNEFLLTMPNSNAAVGITGTSGIFSAAHTPGAAADTLAFGSFRLKTTSYSGDTYFIVDWDTAPSVGNAFVGVANFSTDRWDWFKVPANNLVAVASGFDGSYRNAQGETYVTMLISGSETATLDYVRLGDNQAPVPDLQASPLSGNTSDVFTLDASGSIDPDGEIANYTFFANETIYDNGTNPVLSGVQFSSPGDQFCVVTVTDDDLQQEQASLTIPVVAGPHAVLSVLAPRIDLGDSIDFNGSLSDGGEGSITKYEFDPEGDGTFTDNGTDPVLAGFVYSTAGTFNAALRITTDSNDTDTAIVVMRVDWHRSFNGPSGNCSFQQVLPLPDGSCFACGSVDLSGGENDDALIMRLDPAGEVVWKRRLFVNMSAGSDSFGSMALDSGGALYAAGTVGSGGVSRLELVKLDPLNGTLAYDLETALPDDEAWFNSMDLLVDSQDRLHIVGRLDDGNRAEIFAFRYSNTGLLQQGMRIDDNSLQVDRYFSGAAIDSSDNIYIGSTTALGNLGSIFSTNLTSVSTDYVQNWNRILNTNIGGNDFDTYANGVCVSGNKVCVSGIAQNSANDLYYGYALASAFDGQLAWADFIPPDTLGGELSFGPCSANPNGGIYCGGYTKTDINATQDALLMNIGADGSIVWGKQYGLGGEEDTSVNCAPVSFLGQALFLGADTISHDVVFNDSVYSLATPNSVDWDASPALDIDAINTTAGGVSYSYVDFSFNDTDMGGGWISRYHP